jgi:LacI family transcriptional regulator
VGATRIIGYDDIVPAKVSVPSLTSVATSGQLLGEIAARSVLAVISGAESTVRSHLAEPRLIVRESCGDHVGGDAPTT